MRDNNRRKALNKQNAEINLGKVRLLLMLSTDNRIVKDKAKNRKKENRRKLYSFLKQNMLFEGNKSKTGVDKQKSVQEWEDYQHKWNEFKNYFTEANFRLD